VRESCAATSRARLGLVVPREPMSAVFTVRCVTEVPQLYSFFLLIAYPPAIWFGGCVNKSPAIFSGLCAFTS
jgi:hypothetical protein